MAKGEIAAADPSTTGCPLDPVLNFFASKWLVHIVWSLGQSESMRFAELQRRLPGNVSAKVLSERLKDLDALGIVLRDDKHMNPPHVEYRLTAYGRAVNEFLTMVELQSRRVLLPNASRTSGFPQPNA